jgi:hypothetical protein
LISRELQQRLNRIRVEHGETAAFAYLDGYRDALVAARNVFYRFEINEAPFDPDLMCVEGANMAESRIEALYEETRT